MHLKSVLQVCNENVQKDKYIYDLVKRNSLKNQMIYHNEILLGD